MRKKKPVIATLDLVQIKRDGEYAMISYIDPSIATTHLKVGPEIQRMTDQEILDLHNYVIQAQNEMARQYHHVAREIPPGRPQISYFSEGNQWTSRGHVLRCLIDDGGPDNEPVISIDDQELSLEEFGRLLRTYAGWGMRMVFVPEDEIEKEPQISVCDYVDDSKSDV
ncbi:MAG: hypothetical protein WC975_16360 [Phycisphaerae bacterium]